MRHGRARRLLTRLVDGGLPPGTRGEVRAHLRGCPRCRRRLREHQAVEALVRLLPPSLVPRESSPSAQLRLWALACWFADPMAAWRARLELGAVGLGVVALGLVVSVSTGLWSPLGAEPAGVLLLAQAGAPDAVSMLPLGWR